jgi:predicted RNA-binding protein associated with RNAse of E/G family
MLQIYRKRIIPSECILLKDDEIVEQTPEYIITRWKTLKPKSEFDHGSSCYYLNQGIKVSKFYRADGSLLYWYCDIVEFDWSEDGGTLIVTDLLADVVLYPSGRLKVMDLDELADAMDQGLITSEQMSRCLHQLSDLLLIIDRDKFDRFQACLDEKGL